MQMGGSSPSGRILTTAAIVGGLSFVVGFIGPALTSDSNLGPLLGIFVTGPLGFLLGILIGVVMSAARRTHQPATTEVRWLAAAWLGAILFTLASAIAGISWLSIAAQAAVAICAIIVFYSTPSHLPEGVRRSRPAILAAAALVMGSSIFPPIESRSTDAPAFAFFLDERFDASTRVPEYTVDTGALLIAWSVIAALIALIILARSEDRSRSV